MKRQVILEHYVRKGNLEYFSLIFHSLNSLKTCASVCLTAECHHAVMCSAWQRNKQTSQANVKPRRLLRFLFLSLVLINSTKTSSSISILLW